MSFANPQRGFLLLGGDDGAMGQDSVWLYRTSDGGAHWSLAAATPAATGATVDFQPGPGQIPAACDKNGLTFPTARMAGSPARAMPAWPTPYWSARTAASAGATSRCRSPPRPAQGPRARSRVPSSSDGIGFVTVEPQPDTPALLVTRDLGQTWEQLPLPAGLQYPQITFFSPTEGCSSPRETQGAFGSTFYTTTDGGQTWTPVPQGANLTRLGVTIDFANPAGRLRLDQRPGERPGTADLDLRDHELRSHLARLHPEASRVTETRPGPASRAWSVAKIVDRWIHPGVSSDPCSKSRRTFQRAVEEIAPPHGCGSHGAKDRDCHIIDAGAGCAPIRAACPRRAYFSWVRL